MNVKFQTRGVHKNIRYELARERERNIPLLLRFCPGGGGKKKI